MYIKVLIALMLFAASINYPYAVEMSVVYFVAMSTFFYYSVLKVFTGLIHTEISKGDLLLPGLTVLVNIGGLVVIGTSEYWYMVLYCLSFVATTIYAYVLSALLTYDFIEIKPQEDE